MRLRVFFFFFLNQFELWPLGWSVYYIKKKKKKIVWGLCSPFGEPKINNKFFWIFLHRAGYKIGIGIPHRSHLSKDPSGIHDVLGI